MCLRMEGDVVNDRSRRLGASLDSPRLLKRAQRNALLAPLAERPLRLPILLGPLELPALVVGRVVTFVASSFSISRITLFASRIACAFAVCSSFTGSFRGGRSS
jgi:hypothetical protein